MECALRGAEGQHSYVTEPELPARQPQISVPALPRALREALPHSVDQFPGLCADDDNPGTALSCARRVQLVKCSCGTPHQERVQGLDSAGWRCPHPGPAP